MRIHNYTIFKSSMGMAPGFNSILSSEVQRFIHEHELTDESALVLKEKEIFGVPIVDIAHQIVGRRKSKTKLPTLYNTPRIVYPPKINLEQCSSEKTAKYKSGLVTGKIAVDLTAGFGVDSYFLSKRFETITYIDPDQTLLEIARHNHSELGLQNISYLCTDAASFLKSSSESFDLIYIDPSRRNSANRKIFKFSDCSPNIVELLPLILKKSKHILLKASPLIDIQQGLRELQSVSKIFIIGFDNECKEVLFLIDHNNSQSPIIEAVDITNPAPTKFSFTLPEERSADIQYSDPLEFLYEPSAMILKTGAFKLVAKRFQLKKIAPNTHLYTSAQHISDFPGRAFKITDFVKPDAKSIKVTVPEGYLNIITRNYPLTPSQLKKKLKTQDGGERYAIAFSGLQKKYLALANRVK
ncbi:MAG: class I SAM-dependent methyltransferase [Cyclobacteriaceae bacterium]